MVYDSTSKSAMEIVNGALKYSWLMILGSVNVHSVAVYVNLYALTVPTVDG